MDYTIEVDANLVSSQSLILRDISNDSFHAKVNIYECAKPCYVLVFLINKEDHSSLRMDIHKHDLAAEIRRWLEGSNALTALLPSSKRLDENMMKFVKFGNPPEPNILHKWILSRSELSWTKAKLCFGGMALFDDEEAVKVEDNDQDDDFIHRRLTSHLENTTKSRRNSSFHELELGIRDQSIFEDHSLHRSPETKSFRMKQAIDVDTSSYDLTRKLLGRSHALEMLKKNRRMTSKQRVDAVTSTSIGSLSTEQYVLGADIEKTRKEIAEAIEIRRRAIEVFKVRQQQTAAKYNAVRESIKLSKQVLFF